MHSQKIDQIEKSVIRIVKRDYSIFKKFYRSLKYHLLILVRKEDTPESIAHGMAIGITVGFLPVIPFQALFALFFCKIFNKNIFAGVIGTNIFTNAIIALPVFYLIHFVGKIFIKVDVSYAALRDKFLNFSLAGIAEFGWDLYLAIFLGGMILSVIFYWPTFHFTRLLVIRHRQKRKKL